MPFTGISLYKIADPQRGDIIIFDSAAAGKRLVKRVIGVPGDRISMHNNTLYINGQRLDYQDTSNSGPQLDKVEDLLGLKHAIRVHSRVTNRASFATVEVPPEHYLALGDNRDNSADSRVIGFIPRDEIVGKSKRVAVSFNYDNFYLPRAERFWHQL